MLAGRKLVLAYYRGIVWWKGGAGGRDVFCHVQLEFFSPLPLLSSPVLLFPSHGLLWGSIYIFLWLQIEAEYHYFCLLIYWICCFRLSIENVDSRRLSLQMFSTANCGWLLGTGSITVTTCFPLKWRKKSLLWSLWTVQDTGKYIANPIYQRWCCWKKKKTISFTHFFCLLNCKDGHLQVSRCEMLPGVM